MDCSNQERDLIQWEAYGSDQKNFDWRVHSIWDRVIFKRSEYLLVRWIPADKSGLKEYPMQWKKRMQLQACEFLFEAFVQATNDNQARPVKGIQKKHLLIFKTNLLNLFY